MNPNALGAFGRLGNSLAVDEDYLSEAVDAQLTRIGEELEGAWRISRHEYCGLHPALQRRMLREACRRVSGDVEGLSHAMTLELVAWAQSARTGAKRDIGAGLELRIDYDDIWIKRLGSQLALPGYRLIPSDTDIVITAAAPYTQHGLRISLTDPAAALADSSKIVLKTGCHPRLRTRRPGDRFKPKGMGGQSRKLKDWMIDRKIPRYLRDGIPLVAADGEVIAICLGQTWRLAEPIPPDSLDSSSPVLNLA